MPQDETDLQALTPGAFMLIDAAIHKQESLKHERLAVSHWLLALLERHGPMAERAVQGLEAKALKRQVEEQPESGAFAAPLDRETVLRRALEHARARGQARASERDLACVILAAAGYQVADQAATPLVVATTPGSTAPEAAPEAAGYQSRATAPTPTLQQFGRDLTREAAEGKLGPVIGRADEIQLAIEILCRRTKRNPALVGPAGVGKTAIVEGLAQRVVRGEVPAPLRGVRIFSLQPSTLIAGANVFGELEKRIKAVIAEASQDGIILFLDELHSLVGTGGMSGTGDVASQIKPSLARGELACIAATTDDEYRRFVEPDAALERRFQPIRVNELSPNETLKVLAGLRDMFQRQRGVQVPDEVLAWLVGFAQRCLRNRYFPDKGVDLLEQCVAYALTQGKATVEQADAVSVAERMVGMPLDPQAGLTALGAQLAARGLLTEEDASTLLSRLRVSLLGLDMRPTRPNATVLLVGEAAVNGKALAETIAASLFGAAERIVEVDLSRLQHPADISFLVGAAPGYIGYSDSLVLHRVAQMPWCVVFFQNVSACHPAVRTLLTEALANGYLTDGRGRRIYFSDTVVLFTGEVYLRSERGLGFGKSGVVQVQDVHEAAAEVLEGEFLAQIDLLCAQVPASDEAQRRWLSENLLGDLAARYAERGLTVHWDETLIDWLMAGRGARAGQRDWERFVDEQLSPLLIARLPAMDQKEVRAVTVSVQGGVLQVSEAQNPTGGQ